MEQLCKDAIANDIAGLCIPPLAVKDAQPLLQDSKVILVTVIGFPFGYTYEGVKLAEVKKAIEDGATEINAIINPIEVKNKEYSKIKNELQSIVSYAHFKDTIVKYIIETAMLNDEELKNICDICNEINVDYVKTSTGYNGEGATVEVVKKLRKLLNANIKIKASGGIRDLATVQEMIKAGANRIGTSSAISILNEIK